MLSSYKENTLKDENEMQFCPFLVIVFDQNKKMKSFIFNFFLDRKE
jgi:hypothetical protein